jgi:hypothetical protein
MKLYFLKEYALDTLKGNISSNLSDYTKPSNNWINEFFHEDSVFVEYKKEVSDFTLDMSFEKPEESDIQNIKTLYSAMKNLNETEATDERLWAGLAHGQFWSFMRYRWSLDSKFPTEREILSRFFFGQSKRRSLITNTLSKYWWIGKLTYDEKRSNPFELTEYLKHDFATRILILFSSNYSSNATIVRALISTLIMYQKQGINIDRYTFTEVTKYLNVLGGTYILDYFNEDELSEKISKKINYLLSEHKKTVS